MQETPVSKDHRDRQGTLVPQVKQDQLALRDQWDQWEDLDPSELLVNQDQQDQQAKLDLQAQRVQLDQLVLWVPREPKVGQVNEGPLETRVILDQ